MTNAESEQHCPAGEAVWRKRIKESKEEGDIVMTKILEVNQFKKDEDGNVFIEMLNGLIIPLGHINEGLELLEQPNH